MDTNTKLAIVYAMMGLMMGIFAIMLQSFTLYSIMLMFIVLSRIEALASDVKEVGN